MNFDATWPLVIIILLITFQATWPSCLLKLSFWKHIITYLLECINADWEISKDLHQYHKQKVWLSYMNLSPTMQGFKHAYWNMAILEQCYLISLASQSNNISTNAVMTIAKMINDDDNTIHLENFLFGGHLRPYWPAFDCTTKPAHITVK